MRRTLTCGLWVALVVTAQLALAAASGSRADKPTEIPRAGVAVATDESAALEALDGCLTRPSVVAGSGSLAQLCPDLAAAITELGLDSQLEPGWREHLKAASLKGLVNEVRRYRSRPPSVAPALDRLPRALRSLNTSAPAHLSWWQRLERWLVDLLTPATSSDDSGLWQLLSRLSLPRLLQRVLLYLTVAAVLSMAAWVVVSELKAAGVIGRRTTRRGSLQQGVPATVPTSDALRFADLDHAALSERCVLLVRLLVQALRDSGRLAHERTLTYRELTAQPVFDDTGQRGRFAHLAQLAEQQRYGSLLLQPEEWTALLEEGSLLYDRWLTAPTATRGGTG